MTPRTPARPRSLPGIRLGRIAGIPIILAPSWLISAAVIVFLVVPVVPRLVPGTSTGSAVVIAAALAVLLGVSVLAHELGHCLVARVMGLGVRSVRLYVIGGVSELSRTPKSAAEEALIAGAGPVSSAIVGVSCWLLVPLVPDHSVTWLLLLELALANGTIAAFNFVPALPLDGGRVLRAIIWAITGRYRLGTVVAVIDGLALAVAMLVAAVWFGANKSAPGYLQAGIFAAMGLFVAVGATSEWPKPDPRRRVAGWARPLVTVPAALSPAELALATAGMPALVIQPDGRVAGIVSASETARPDASPGPAAQVWHIDPRAVIAPGDRLVAAARVLADSSIPYAVVVDETGSARAILDRADLARALTAREREEHA